ncbi:twin-arginine translocase subunit TatC [Salinigranum sp.]|uniref:twin-arginine translocase subunit TatC n=1 Tax=Salinigranum sp. TaxID=1966351 RepID=UPI0035697791
MGDDSEPHGSRPEDSEDSVDTDAVVGAERPSDVDSGERPDSADGGSDATPDVEPDVDSGSDSAPDSDAADDTAPTDTDGDDVAPDESDAASAETDGAASGPDDVDWTTYAAADRDADGIPNPTPPPSNLVGDDPDRIAGPGDGDEEGDASDDSDATAASADVSTASSGDATGDTDATGDSEGSADDTDDGFEFDEPRTDDGVETNVQSDDATASAAPTEAPATSPVAEPESAGEAPADARDAPATSSEVVEDAPAYDPAIADDDGDFFDGPESDVEMPLADHIEEMVRRLGVVFLIAGVVGVVVFPIADDLVNFLWNTHIPGATTIESRRPRLYGPLELILTELKVAGLAGFVVGLPVFVYQTYRFMRPGLYPRERKYYLAAVPTSLILAFVGVAFAHFVVLPAIFAYFTSYTIGTAVIAFGLKETFGLILVLMGYMALVFQIPLFIMLAIMMDLVTRQWLTEKRLLFWGGFLGLSFLVSPDPTGMAPIIIAATMITLFEGTLLLLRWVD